MKGLWDCSNVACSAYHEIAERPYHGQGGRTPRCPSCQRHLRLLRVKRSMPESVKRALREKAVSA